MIIEQRKPKGCCLAGMGIVALPVVLVVGLAAVYLILRLAGAVLIIADPLEKVDAVVVLSGGSERLPEAARLMRERYGNWLVLTETGEIRPGVFGSDDLHAEANRLGIPSSSILITERTVTSTRDEAVAVLHLMQERNLSSCIVVTDPFHTLRTRVIFRDIFRGSDKEIIVSPVPASWYRSRDWFLSARGWQYTAQEYFKLTLYLLGFRLD
ncbi:MAG: YdcF family protein [Anaerolineaceae bacterium]|nr:YdcF family protein [Anaerolineaceae bacterium]